MCAASAVSTAAGGGWMANGIVSIVGRDDLGAQDTATVTATPA